VKCAFRKRGDCTSGKHDHHVIPRARIKARRRHVSILNRRPNCELTEPQRRLLTTAITRILKDVRNLIRLCDHHHHQVHHFGLRLTAAILPTGLSQFAAEFDLEAALDHELRLMAR
jgi:hypothetical protein